MGQSCGELVAIKIIIPSSKLTPLLPDSNKSRMSGRKRLHRELVPQASNGRHKCIIIMIIMKEEEEDDIIHQAKF